MMGSRTKKDRRLAKTLNGNKVISTFGSRTAEQLSAWTHRPGGPWELALVRGKGVMNSPVSKDDMRDYFSRILNTGAIYERYGPLSV
jgi:uncharacterized phage-associated protein